MTLERYKKHVEKFGPEGVMETARETLTFEQLVELQTACDTAEQARQKFPKRTRKTAEQKVRELLGLTEEDAPA